MRKKKYKYIKPITIVFCIPGGPFSHNFLKSWTNLLGWCNLNNIVTILINAQDSVVYYARNKCLGGNVLGGIKQKPYQGEIKYDYLMWIDSDMVFEPKHLLALINMNTDIASGIYKMQDNYNYATVENMKDEEYTKKGSYTFLNDDSLKNKPDIFPVDYTGFGWILIKKGVFEKIEYPWFRPLWKEFEGDNKMKEFTSEDVGICQLFRDSGFTILVNKNIKVGHEKSWILI